MREKKEKIKIHRLVIEQDNIKRLFIIKQDQLTKKLKEKYTLDDLIKFKTQLEQMHKEALTIEQEAKNEGCKNFKHSFEIIKQLQEIKKIIDTYRVS